VWVWLRMKLPARRTDSGRRVCRVGPEAYETALEKKGCREMDFAGKPMKGYVFVSEEGLRKKKDLDLWIELCLAFNKTAKASKKKK